MDELNLTDEQVAELATMGIAGEMAADALRLWREAPAGPVHSTYGLSYELTRATEHARNTAELRAAATFHKHLADIAESGRGQAESSVAVCMFDDIGREHIDALQAIAQAYAEIRQCLNRKA